jgi:hypothetical protein
VGATAARRSPRRRETHSLPPGGARPTIWLTGPSIDVAGSCRTKGDGATPVGRPAVERPAASFIRTAAIGWSRHHDDRPDVETSRGPRSPSREDVTRRRARVDAVAVRVMPVADQPQQVRQHREPDRPAPVASPPHPTHQRARAPLGRSPHQGARRGAVAARATASWAGLIGRASSSVIASVWRAQLGHRHAVDGRS